MFRYCVVFAMFNLCAIGTAPAYDKEPRVLSTSIVSSDGGPHEWYSIEADPEAASNLIACGMMWNARDNANYGFVYSSQDAGKTWHLALEDKNSKWVSEESCAFGVHGVAYFVSDASKVDEAGNLHHDQGTTRIWVSRDSGRTWSLGTTTGWTDCSSSIVDRRPGPNENRLYVFFNEIVSYYSSLHDRQAIDRLPQQSQQDKKVNQRPGNTVGLISYRDGDNKVVGPIFNPEMYKLGYYGAYTHQNLMLKDGSLLTLFWSKKKSLPGTDRNRTGSELIFSAQHSDPAREKLHDPVVLYTALYQPGVCTSFTNAPAVYDAAKNTVYVAYLDGSEGTCKLMLTTSTDDGQTWTTGHVSTGRQDPDAKAGEALRNDSYSSLAMARNQDGTLAILWRNSMTSNCWYFATSTDDGNSYSHPLKVSSCSDEMDVKYQASDAYLSSGVRQAEEGKSQDDASLAIRAHINSGGSHVSGIAVSPDRVFHPIWNTFAGGEGQLRTAAIVAIKAQDTNIVEPVRGDGWKYVTNNVTFLYGGTQRYDIAKSLLTESIIIRNSGSETLKAPLRLEIDARSPRGLIWPLDVTTEASGPNTTQYLDIQQYLLRGDLPPGTSSVAIPLDFYFELYAGSEPDGSALANISLRLLARQSK